MNPRNSMAANATLHCLTGCAIGEIVGLMIGTAMGLSNAVTIALAVVLAFLFGYSLSTLPLIQAGLGFFAALSVVFAADTLSIAVMEITDNLVMAVIPGAMDAGLVNPIFWIGMMIALTAAFVAAFPVNRYLIDKGKGHALTHQFHEGHQEHAAHASGPHVHGADPHSPTEGHHHSGGDAHDHDEAARTTTAETHGRQSDAPGRTREHQHPGRSTDRLPARGAHRLHRSRARDRQRPAASHGSSKHEVDRSSEPG